MLYINLPYNAWIFIFDINGRLVVSKQIYSGRSTIDLENLVVYLVKLIGDKGAVTKEVILE
jgi:hypothetical protein